MANKLFQSKERTFADSGYALNVYVKADTESGLPTTGVTEGDLAYAKDTDCVYSWDGSAWTKIVKVGGTGSDTWKDQVWYRASANADDEEFRTGAGTWTQVDKSTDVLTWVQQDDLICTSLPGPGTESSEMHALLKAPSGIGIGTSISCCVRATCLESATTQAGLVFADGTTYGAGTQVFFGLQCQVGNQYTQMRRTNFTTFAAGGNSSNYRLINSPWVFMRMTWTAANTFRYEGSINGITWIRLFADTAHTITPTHAGIAVISNTGAATGTGPASLINFEFFRVAY